ncbi:related to Oxidoreductase, short-chain dehydrogenase [Cephalotrichum gorgonifer]|uniref:Related to Oxidoreductase, short-chain dehydrogenase n=1 Tax=Cephalotrichum gorgonifer TaxID=2041049 RepID=A0AAE8N2S9_9PEZI|nr:related to Oxidoreductase, short-chain dehydrogenase [Cephalotrichum gorgonifer]
MWSIISQAFPPAPNITEDTIPDLHGKVSTKPPKPFAGYNRSPVYQVYIVTGSNVGVGKEVARILYSKHAKVYVAARSAEKAKDAIDAIKALHTDAKGELFFLRLDLADLTTIKQSAEEFLSKESKLHVLFNNAGVMTPPQGSVTAQGYELQLGVNNIGTFMFTKLLTPLLAKTAGSEPAGTVRVVWVSSTAAENASRNPGGVPIDELDDYQHEKKWRFYRYGFSKAGNYLHAVEYAKRHREDGIVSIPLNPGNLDSELYRGFNPLIRGVLRRTVLHPAVYGAYTELFAGLSTEVTMEKSGSWVVPWGRFMDIRRDLVEATKAEAEGGTGVGKRFWEWTEAQIKPYL